MYCRFCLEDGKKRVAVALAAQTYSGRRPLSPVYEFHPVCEDHLSTWNDVDNEEYYPCYEIVSLEDCDRSRTTVGRPKCSRCNGTGSVKVGDMDDGRLITAGCPDCDRTGLPVAS